MKSLIFKSIWFYLMLLMASIFLAMTFGSYTLSPKQIVFSFFNNSSSELNPISLIVTMRINRILIAITCGSLLALSGAVLQRILRNPLADPFILGISAGASVWVALSGMLVLPVTYLGFSCKIIFAFIGSFSTIAALFFFRRFMRVMDDSLAIPIIGMVLNAFYSSFLMILIALGSKGLNFEVYRWMLGSFDNISLQGAFYFLLCGIVFIIWLTQKAVVANTLGVGENLATSLGFDAKKEKIKILLIISTVIALVVSVSGAIGFIGLLVPHLTRFINFQNNVRKEWLVVSIIGSIMLVLADLFSRSLINGIELPVGIFTASFGAPFLAWIVILKTSKSPQQV